MIGREENGVAADSTTETYIAMRFFIDNWRWGGVPFYFYTGKRMQESRSEIVIHFKNVPHRLFSGICPRSSCNELILKVDSPRYEKRLDTGTYYFWNYGREVSCKIFNMKIQQLDISGQEILTADKVAVRLNVICNYRIVNPERLVQQVEGVASQLYTYAQLKLREYVGKYRGEYRTNQPVR